MSLAGLGDWQAGARRLKFQRAAANRRASPPRTVRSMFRRQIFPPLAAAVAAIFGACAPAPRQAVAPDPDARQTALPSCTGMEPFETAVLPGGGSMRDAFEALAAEFRADPNARPVLFPGTDRPRAASDVSELGRLLREVYPAGLRDAGITRSAMVALLVDAAGTVKYMQVTKSSGYREMDVAALRFAQALRFHPAVANGCRVPAFVHLPLNFTLAR